MNKINDLKEEFKNPIVSLQDFQERLRYIKSKAKEYYQKSNTEIGDFRFFYRGDMRHSPLKPKIFNEPFFKNEAKCFKCQKTAYIDETENANDIVADFKILARMQHAGEITRLLDFTTDPLVALRFACGRENEDYDKKVTVFYTNVIIENKLDETIPALMKLVKSDNLESCTSEETAILLKDYFIDAQGLFKDNERLTRQKGMFLMMGNFSNIHHPEYSETKVAHQLSDHDGRGKQYPGMIGTLKISGSHVANIRKAIEDYEENGKRIYSINYLMNHQKEQK